MPGMYFISYRLHNICINHRFTPIHELIQPDHVSKTVLSTVATHHPKQTLTLRPFQPEQHKVQPTYNNPSHNNSYIQSQSFTPSQCNQHYPASQQTHQTRPQLSSYKSMSNFKPLSYSVPLPLNSY